MKIKYMVLLLGLMTNGAMAKATDIFGTKHVLTTEGDNTYIKVAALNAESTGEYVIEETYTYSMNYGCITNAIAKKLTISNDKESAYSKAVKLTLPKTLTTIEDSALWKWTALEEIAVNAETAPTLGKDALPASLQKIIVPEEKANEYAEAEGWKEWAEIIVDVNGEKASAGTDPDTNPTKLAEEKSVQYEISGRQVKLGELQKVTVYDLMGMKVYEGRTDVIILPHSGMYILVTESGKGIRVRVK